MSLYIHSDLRGFKPSETTYVFFGRRGSGKTTIRLQLEGAYRTCNAALVASGRSKGHFWCARVGGGRLVRNCNSATFVPGPCWEARTCGEKWALLDVSPTCDGLTR